MGNTTRKIVKVTPAGEGHQVITVVGKSEAGKHPHRKTPCGGLSVAQGSGWAFPR